MSRTPRNADVHAVVEQFHETLLSLCEQVMSGATAADFEHDFAQEMTRIGLAALEVLFKSAGEGDFGEAIEVKLDGQVRVFRRRMLVKRDLLTCFGKIEGLSRHLYVDEAGRQLYPLDAQLQLSIKNVTPLLQKWICLLAVGDELARVGDLLQQLRGVAVCTRTIRNTTLHRAEGSWEFLAEIKPAQAEPGTLVIASADGKGVTRRREGEPSARKKLTGGQKRGKKKMATVGVAFSIEPREHDVDAIARMEESCEPTPRPRPQAKSVRGHLTDRDRVLADLRRHVLAMLRPGMPLIINIDGCPKLESAIQAAFADLEPLILLDWYHLSEYIWGAVKALYSDQAGRDKRYEKLCRLLLAGKVSSAIASLKQTMTKKKPRSTRLIEKAIKYMNSHRHLMGYPQAIRLGAPIASGAVEGACNHLLNDRLNKSGMRWGLEGGQAVIDLRAMHISGVLSEHHEWSVKREAKELHGWFETFSRAA